MVKKQAQNYLENCSEATAACLVTMVQGNLLSLGLSHWLIASETGLIAGTVTSAAVILTRATRPWIVSSVLGLATTVVDFYVHPGMFGPIFAEAVVTGLGAALLSLGVQYGIRALRRRLSSD
ncbi:MAG: hypothetical protein AB8G23_15975 [Myxococcota bacterium]